MMMQQQQISQLQPSQLESLPNQIDDVNGLPAFPMKAAISQFVQEAQQYDHQRELESQQHKTPNEHDFEEAGKIDADSLKIGSGIHSAVPNIQKWLSAMNPMTYVAPTFTNPVAAQLLNQLSDPKMPSTERMRIQKLVSSPYMFNMLGNPAYADPKIWTGLVSGAAVPYPLTNTIMSQRTGLPGRIAVTGVAMSDFDRVAMTAYADHHKDTPPNKYGPFAPNHVPKKAIGKIKKQIHTARNSKIRRSTATPHAGPTEDFTMLKSDQH